MNPSPLITLLRSITRREWHFVVWMILLLLVLTSAPYLYGWINAAPKEYFLGLHTLSPGDFPVYYSYIEQVKQGHFLLNDLFTSEPHTPFLNILWLGVGLFAKWFHLSAILAFHLSRLLLIPLFIVGLYIFLAYFFTETRQRRIALMFSLFASGFGGLLSSLAEKFPASNNPTGYYHWPMDLWVAESNTFLTLYQTPHFIASLLFLLLIFFFGLIALEHNSWKYAAASGLCALLLLQFHPFHAPTIAVVFITFFAMESIRAKKILWRTLGHISLIGFIALPSFLYHIFLFLFDDATSLKAQENITLTAVPWLTIVSYGLPLFFSAFSVVHFLQNKRLVEISMQKRFLAVWFIAQSILLYAPLNWQRRLTEGLQIPMMVLAVEGLFLTRTWLLSKFSKIWVEIFSGKIILAYAFLILFAFSNLRVVAQDVGVYAVHSSLFYAPKTTVEAMRALRNLTPKNAVVLAEQKNGNLLPVFSGRRTYAGHWAETIDVQKKVSESRWFFNDNENDEIKIAWLRETGITHIFFSHEENVLGDFRPDEKPYLQKIFSNESTAVYRVISISTEKSGNASPK